MRTIIKSKSFLMTNLLSAAIMSASAYADVKQGGNPYWTQPVFGQEFIIKFKDKTTSTSKALDRINFFNSRFNTSLGHIRKLASGARLMKFDSGSSALSMTQMISQLSGYSDIEYVVPNIRLHTMATPNDPRYNEQWHYFEATGGINAASAWDINNGEGVVVAVVDTGYLPHADLADNIVGGYDFISNSSTAADGDGRDADAKDEGDGFGYFECSGALFDQQNSSWHGTHVAGTISAINNNGIGIAGVASKAKILPIRVLGKCGGSLSDIQDGMLWAAGISVDGVPDNPNPAQIINLSLGGAATCDASSQDVVDQITAKGVTIVVAAGNSNDDASGYTPASCNNVITVAATDRTGGRASYSNYGNVVEIAAPGGATASGTANGVLSTLDSGTSGPVNDDSYAFYQGTSMATPHAAGVAALMYSHKPTVTPTEVKDVLVNTARAFPATCNGCGAGIIDATAALSALGDPGNIPPQPGFSYGVDGLTVTFTDTSTDSDGSISVRTWAFGDGNSSSQQNPTHTYSAVGTYAVSLSVTDNDGATETITQSITLSSGENVPPVAAFSFSASDLTATFTDQSSDSDGSVTSWSWTFGDGAVSSAQNPTHTYAEAGSYTVALTVQDNEGAEHSTSQTVVVEAAVACTEVDDFNYYHKTAGRAYSTGLWAPSYYAQGSDDPMSGSTWGVTTLKSTDGGSVWNVGSCP